MHTTATLYVHPACTSSRRLIEQLQAATGRLVVVSGGKPRLAGRFDSAAAPSSNHPFGGDAA